MCAETCNRRRKGWEKHFAIYQDINTGISLATQKHYTIVWLTPRLLPDISI